MQWVQGGDFNAFPFPPSFRRPSQSVPVTFQSMIIELSSTPECAGLVMPHDGRIGEIVRFGSLAVHASLTSHHRVDWKGKKLGLRCLKLNLRTLLAVSWYLLKEIDSHPAISRKKGCYLKYRQRSVRPKIGFKKSLL